MHQLPKHIPQALVEQQSRRKPPRLPVPSDYVREAIEAGAGRPGKPLVQYLARHYPNTGGVPMNEDAWQATIEAMLWALPGGMPTLYYDAAGRAVLVDDE